MWNKTFLSVGAICLAVLTNPASAGAIFGSKLNHEPTPAEICNSNRQSDLCSWVLVLGQQNVGHEKAPKNGTIVKLRLRSCSAGSFILQLAVAIPAQHKARAVRTGPAINYKGDPSNCEGGNVIETFNVNVPVLKDEYLAVIATKVGFIYSSGDREDVFDPLLADGVGLRATNNVGRGSGLLLLQAEMSN
jgi:hypothetical protein